MTIAVLKQLESRLAPRPKLGPCTNIQYSRRGAVGFSVLRIWPMFGSVFRFLHLKTAVFRFGVLHGLRVFLNVVFGFRFSSTRMAVFRFFVHCILRFCQGRVTSPSRAKSGVIPSQGPFIQYSTLYFREMDVEASLISSRYLGRNGKAQDNIKAKHHFSNIEFLNCNVSSALTRDEGIPRKTFGK